MRRTARPLRPGSTLDVVIRKSTENLEFRNYLAFMDYVLCGKPIAELEGLSEEELNVLREFKEPEYRTLKQKRHLPYTDADAYRLLKVATEAFLVVNCGVWIADPRFGATDVERLKNVLTSDEPPTATALNSLWQEEYLEPVKLTRYRVLPYLALIRKKLPDAPIKLGAIAFDEKVLPQDCYGILQEKLTRPCLIELIWSYWHEEGMLVQTLNAISRRFQNIRGPAEQDPLAMLEIDPLRPLNNLLWGYIQDEQHRLTIVRRAYEYDHHYGLTLYGKAVPPLRPADSRSRFIEEFHTLLYLCSVFFKEDDDTTVIADGFPVLNAIREVHFVLAEGAHNQFGDLPSTARIEMLMQQWLLARPEFREFLPTRIMVAYPEPWMDRVDAMKKLQGWTDASVREFHDLALFGEQILLSIRYGVWGEVHEPDEAANWARWWRAEIQGYIHAYRAVTGVDLTVDATDSGQAALRSTQPSVLLRERLALQQVRQPGLVEARTAMASVVGRPRPAIGKLNP